MDSSAVSVAPNCTICLEPVIENVGRSTAKLQCGHIFHLDCIGSEFNVKGAMQCPNCRATEDGQWLFADDDIDESIQDEGEEEEVVEMQPSLLHWYMLHGFGDFLSLLRRMRSILNATTNAHQLIQYSNFHGEDTVNVDGPSHYNPPPARGYATTNAHQLIQYSNFHGEDTVNVDGPSHYNPPPARGSGAGLHVVRPLVHRPEYQAIPQAPSYPYERNSAPTSYRIRISSQRSPPPHLIRAPMYVPVRSSNNIGVMNSPTLTPLPSHHNSHYTVAPSAHMRDDGSRGLQLPPHAFAGLSNGGQSAGRVVIENETSESYGHTFFEFL